jgi:hypothetical protein
MEEKHRLEGFKRLIASDKSGSYELEDADGMIRPWKELSAEGKLDFIAGAAVMYDVPFDQFAKAARQELNAAALTEGSLRAVLDYRRELRALAKLLPDDGRTESTPLVDRFREWLRMESGDRNLLLAHDTVESTKTQLESFSDEFERLARTAEQRKLVAAFKDFVGEVTGAGMRETFERLLKRYADKAAMAPEKSKDKGIER